MEAAERVAPMDGGKGKVGAGPSAGMEGGSKTSPYFLGWRFDHLA
jgi:hypothetical protein